MEEYVDFLRHAINEYECGMVMAKQVGEINKAMYFMGIKTGLKMALETIEELSRIEGNPIQNKDEQIKNQIKANITKVKS